MENFNPWRSAAPVRAHNHERTRQHNLRLIVSLLLQRGQMSRQELVRNTGLSPGTASILCRELCRRRILTETDIAAQTRGRPNRIVRVTDSGGYVLGVHPEPHRICGVAAKLDGSLLLVEKVLGAYPSPTLLASQTVHLIERLETRCKASVNGPLLGVGIGVPDIPSSEHSALQAEFARRDLKSLLVFEPASAAMVYSELVSRPGAKEMDLLCLRWDEQGMGLAVCRHGQFSPEPNQALRGLGDWTFPEGDRLESCNQKLKALNFSFPPVGERLEVSEAERAKLIEASQWLSFVVGNALRVYPASLVLIAIPERHGGKLIRDEMQTRLPRLLPVGVPMPELEPMGGMVDSVAKGMALRTINDLIQKSELLLAAHPHRPSRRPSR